MYGFEDEPIMRAAVRIKSSDERACFRRKWSQVSYAPRHYRPPQKAGVSRLTVVPDHHRAILALNGAVGPTVHAKADIDDPGLGVTHIERDHRRLTVEVERELDFHDKGSVHVEAPNFFHLPATPTTRS